MDESAVRAVHRGDVSRTSLKEDAGAEGFPRTAGDRAHRLIRAHENLEALIAFYLDGVAHAMSGAEAPEVEGNVADVTVKYPHGRPVRGIERLMRDHELDPGEWDVDSLTVNEWPTTIGSDDGVIYVNNYQAKARLTRIERQPQFPEPKQVHAQAPPVDPPAVEVGESPKPDSWDTALLWSDPHYGFNRDERTGDLIPVHDRHAIDLVKQVAALADIDRVCLLGDGVDAPSISDYQTEPDVWRTLQPSYFELDYDWAQIRHAAQPEQEDYIEGNHDERIRERLLDGASEMYQLHDVQAIRDDRPPQLSLRSLLKLEQKGVTWHGDYPDSEVRLNAGLSLAHDWGSLGSKSGHTAYKTLRDQKGEISRVQGHGHRHEEAWFTNWEGQTAKEYMFLMLGCLSRLDGIVEGVKARQNWQHSFALAHYDPGGWQHTIEPIKVYASRSGGDHRECYFRGCRLRSRAPDLERLSEETGIRYTRSPMPA